MIISISACMAGAVCGDHCSPISDTTIMASAGAQCDHVNHVSTQLPYAMTAAAVSFVTYIIADCAERMDCAADWYSVDGRDTAGVEYEKIRGKSIVNFKFTMLLFCDTIEIYGKTKNKSL